MDKWRKTRAQDSQMPHLRGKLPINELIQLDNFFFLRTETMTVGVGTRELQAQRYKVSTAGTIPGLRDKRHTCAGHEDMLGPATAWGCVPITHDLMDVTQDTCALTRVSQR